MDYMIHERKESMFGIKTAVKNAIKRRLDSHFLGPNTLQYRYPAWRFRTQVEFEAACRASAQTVPIGPESLLACVLGNQKIILSTRDLNVSAHLAIEGFWESWISMAVVKHVKPGWRCIDVGANCGYYTLLLGNLVGPNGRVWAIEPNPIFAQPLRTSVALNGLKWAAIENCAVAGQVGTFRLSIPGGHHCGGTICDVPAAAESFEVQGRPLDDICAGEMVDFVKIDVEGAEEQVWAGMKKIRSHKSVKILLEYNANRHHDPAAFLRALGDDGFPLRFVDIDCEIKPVSIHTLVTDKVGQEWMLWLER